LKCRVTYSGEYGAPSSWQKIRSSSWYGRSEPETALGLLHAELPQALVGGLVEVQDSFAGPGLRRGLDQPVADQQQRPDDAQGAFGRIERLPAGTHSFAAPRSVQ
jgi:hypothetical protein